MHFQVVEITLDVALASIRFLPIITLQCMWMSKDDVTKIGEGKDVDQPYILVYTYSPSFYAGLRYNEKTLFLIYLHTYLCNQI